MSEPFDTQPHVQIAHGGGQAVEVLPARLRYAIDVVGGPASTVRPSGDAAHQEVLDIVARKGVDDPPESGP